MKQFSIMLLVTLLLLGLFALYFIAFWDEDIFVLNPEIDTVFAGNFSKDKYEQVTKGMSTNDVIAIIGQPLSIDRTQKNMGYEEWSYSCDGALGSWGDKAWFYYGIQIKNGVVEGKVTNVFYD